MVMNHFDGTAARQLALIDIEIEADRPAPVARRRTAPTRRPDLRLLRQDVYKAIERRRRQAQIAARRALEDRQR
jgi:hypothetical protein